MDAKLFLFCVRFNLIRRIYFLVAPSYELSDLSTHYGICMLSCGNILYKGNFFMDPQKIIRSQKFQNQNVFHIILSNFFWGELFFCSVSGSISSGESIF